MISILLMGIVAFIAINIDDLFILMLFFANENYKNSHVVIGQFIGVSSLILISLMGYLFKLLIPPSFIGLLGVIPLFIGIRGLINLKRNSGKNCNIKSKKSSVLGVIMVTISNGGGDNIGIYAPLFASIIVNEIIIVIISFLFMILVWCYLGYLLVNHKILGEKIKKYGHIIFPFVLISLGISILFK